MKNLMIDNVGFDVEAMAKMTQKEFVETHLPNDAIGRNLTEETRKKYLRDCYKSIREAAGEKPVEAEE